MSIFNVNEYINSLPESVQAKTKECKTVDDLLNLLSAEGIAVPDELLDGVAGGFIVRDTNHGGYTVFDDNTGKEFYTSRRTDEEANKWIGVSPQEISFDEYTKLFNDRI